VALLVLRDVLHPRAEAGHDAALGEVALDEVLARLGERRLDDEVVHADRRGEVRARLVLAQPVRHLVELLERAPEAPRQLGLRGRQRARDRLAALHDLLHEAAEEDRMARLVDLLRRQKVLLLLARGRVDVGRQVVGDRVLAVEEHRVVPQGRAALEVGELLVPVGVVLAEVQLHRAPVALLPARVQVLVRDPVHRNLRHSRLSSAARGVPAEDLTRRLAGQPVSADAAGDDDLAAVVRLVRLADGVVDVGGRRRAAGVAEELLRRGLAGREAGVVERLRAGSPPRTASSA
jgi:hypothetical protein